MIEDRWAELVEDTRQAAAAKMREWGWQYIVGKDIDFDQTLMDHSLAVVDVLITMLPGLDRQLELTPGEVIGLLLGAAVHDAGKAREEWQQYRRGERGYVPDTDTELAKECIDELAAEYDLPAPKSTLEFVRYHMRKSLEAGTVIDSLLRSQDLRRWSNLSRYVAEADNLASIASPAVAKHHWQKTVTLSQFWEGEYHRVRTRGVVTPLLHEAAQTAFGEYGWIPLLYFPDGTFYIRFRDGIPGRIPSFAQVVETAAGVVARLLNEQEAQIVDNLMVGNITATYMPKPELFDYRKTSKYLWRAAQTIAPTGAHDISAAASTVRRKVPEELHGYIREAKDLSGEEELEARARIGEAYKEIAIFKYFKSIVDVQMTAKQQELTAERYEEFFGPGTFALLLKAGGFSPARDTAFTVDYYWRQPGERVDLTHERVGSASGSVRREKLIELLTDIATEAFEGADTAPTLERVAADIAGWVSGDILYPRGTEADIQEVAAAQLAAYEKGKQTLASERKQLHICPICNDSFVEGKSALADFSDNPEAFTNRGLTYARLGGTTKPQLCMACYAERLLRHVTLGRKTRELLFLFPRGSIGAAAAQQFVATARSLDWWVRSIAQRREYPGLDFSMGMITQLARKVKEVQEDLDRLSGQQLAELFTYSVSADRKKRELRELRRRLERLEWTLEDLRYATGQDFESLDDFCQALWEGEVTATEQAAGLFDELQAVRGETMESPAHIGVVARTANAVIIAGSRPRQPDKPLIPGEGDSDSNAALKELLVSLVLALSLRVSVAALHDWDTLDEDMVSPDGLVWLEPVPALQQLFGGHMVARPQVTGSRWIPLEQGWIALEAIVAACELMRRADFPDRSNLYSVMAQEHPGKLLRRIEQKQGTVNLDDINRIEKVFSFTRPEAVPNPHAGMS